MKELMKIFSILICFLTPYPSFAAFLIELTGGATYLTDRYWEEDGKIRLYQLGGTIAFSKIQIRKIIETDQQYIDPTRFLKASISDKSKDAQKVKRIPGSPKIKERQEESKTKKKEQQVDLSIYQKKKKEIVQQYWEAKNKLSETIKNRDRVAQQMAAREISRIERERAGIAKEIREKNNGVLPSWWQGKNEQDYKY